MTDHQFFVCWTEVQNYTDVDAYLSDLALSSIWDDPDDAEIPSDRIDALRRIWDVANMHMCDVRKACGLTQAQFSDRFCIPRRTVEDWDADKRTPPDYVKILIAKSLDLI